MRGFLKNIKGNFSKMPGLWQILLVWLVIGVILYWVDGGVDDVLLYTSIGIPAVIVLIAGLWKGR
jgi:hypothetical protein